MKKLLSILTLCMGLCCISCYDDSPLVERIDALEKTSIASLEASISSLEAKDVELKASITALEESAKATSAEIQTLKDASAAIEKKITELKEWVKKLIEGYYTKEEIDKQIGSINTEIDALDKKVTELENKLHHILRDFTISFDDSEIGILAGGTASVNYTITGATDKTTVKALGQNGWSAMVTPDGIDKGVITVTAPNPMTNDEIIVLVYDGEYRTIMNSINFVTGVVTPSLTAVELEAEAGTFDITITSNLNYTAYIPDEARSWLSIIGTKSIREDVYSFKYERNEGLQRNATVTLRDACNSDITSILFVQKGSINEIIVDNPGTLSEIINNQNLRKVETLKISGTLNDNDWLTISELNNIKHLDLSDISNNSILKSLFKGNNNIITLILPQSITEIPESICEGCTKLKTVIIPKNITKIGKNAFKNTYELSGDLIIPDSVTEIMDGAFYSSHSAWYAKYNNIELSGTLYIGKNVQTIGDYAFSDSGYNGCLTIPKSVQSIGRYAFSRASNHTSLELNANIKIIQEGAFQGLNIAGELIIPEGVEIIEAYAFEATAFEKIKFPTTLKELSGSVDRSLSLERKADGGQFYNCRNLSNIDIPKTITYIPHNAFALSGLIGDLIIPDNIIEVGCGAFSYTKISTVTLGKNVKFLCTQKQGWSTDAGCFSPFVGCNDIVKFYSKSITPPLCEYPLTANKYLGVPKDAIEAYKKADVWKEFSIIEGVDFE